jgi:hypothetical protein
MVVNLLLRSVIIGLHHERSSSNDLRGILDANGIHEECLSPTIVRGTLRDGNARTLGNDQVAVHHRGMHVTLEVIASGLRRSGERDARAGVGTGDGRGLRQRWRS